MVAAYGAAGVFLHAELPPLDQISIGAGSLADLQSPPADAGLIDRQLVVAGAEGRQPPQLWIDASAAVEELCQAIELALAAVWSARATVSLRDQLEALDAAVRGIGSIASVDLVLQLIVDRVRELAGAQYAALGIVGPFGRIEQFITSGITAEARANIGDLPRGHGLLGLIIREDRAFLIDDIGTDEHSYGFPDRHPEMHSFLGVPVRSKGRSIGNLYLTNKLNARVFSDEDLRLVNMFALHAGIAIENARLHEEIGRLAIVAERERISQDLHDSIIQSLYATSLSLEDLPEVIGEDPDEGAARADRAIDSIHATIRDIRNFIMGLQPEMLEDADLATGIETLGAEFSANTVIDLELHVADALPEVDHDVAAHVLSITREALSNIARHSGATRASLELAANDGILHLVIGDNGHGFDVVQSRSPRQRGLANLHSRADVMGAKLSLNSEPGAGTRLELAVAADGRPGLDLPHGESDSR